MFRALVLIGASAALGAGLTRLLLGARLAPAEALRLQRWGAGLLLLAVVAQLGQIHGHGAVLLAGAGSESPMRAFEASTRTHVGRLLWAQAGLMLLAGFLARTKAGGPATGLLLASLVCSALSGHVAASGASTALSAVALVHVVLAGLWFGGLSALWILWRRAGRDGAGSLAGFSRFALPAMLLILASGVVLAAQTVGRWAALVATPYGWLLLAKLGLVSMALACAVALRRWLARKDRRIGKAPRRWLAGECALACSVVATAGTLAGWVPAAHDAFDWPFGFRIAPQAAWMQRQEQIRGPLGGAAVLIVLGVGVAAALWRRRRRWALVSVCGALASGLAVAVPALTVDAYPTSYAASGAPYDAASVVNGARLYRALCARCHGAGGQGDGPLAATLKPAPADLTAPHLGWHLHGDMYWWITQGFAGSAMPAFAGRTTELERWQLVDYLMALSLGYQARSLGERPVPNAPWLAAIDFRYATADGGNAQLSELASDSAVLLVLIADAAELPRLDALGRVSGLKTLAVLAPGVPLPRVAPPGVELVRDVDGEIVGAWAHYRRTLAQPDFRDEAPGPARMELLIDRYGYVRARWRAGEGAGAPSADDLRAALATLSREPPFPPADVHAH